MSRHKKRKTHVRKPEKAFSIQRPGRYIGREWNLPAIDPTHSIHVAICYPDVYEIGMSHFGLQVMYQIFKDIPGITVERVFAPWPDMEQTLRSRNLVLTTLESRRPLKDCDLICFTLPHELCCTNILNVLDLGGIPIHRDKRTESMPIILGGGIAALNPLPLDAFFDAFFIGEAEQGIPAMMQVFPVGNRKKFLENLASVPGFYIPADSAPGAEKTIVEKQCIADLENAPHPDPPLVPVTRPVHERIVVEAMRGCPRSCRFCQARIFYSPVRHRSPDRIIELVKKNLEQTGYEEVSLLSLNIADYPDVESLLANLMSYLADRCVSISLPSLRPERLTPAMISEIRQVRKTGFTLAPEAGSDRLRKIIGKPFPLDKLLETVESVFKAGWSVIKLYFMIGLPFEKDEDIMSILDLVRCILKIGRSICGNRTAVHVSAATFIPKPHTPFQWCGQAAETDIRRRQQILRDGCATAAIKLSMNDLPSSRLESCLARGDERMGAVIENAFLAGCRMDAWSECFDSLAWANAFKTNDLSMEVEAIRHYVPGQDRLPWSFIHTGIPEEQLVRTYEAAVSAGTDVESQPLPEPPLKKHVPGDSPGKNVQPIHQETHHYLGIFQVLSDFRLFGHMEIFNAVTRAMRRADLPLAYSQGFNPHPKMSWQQPVPLGFERWCEPVEFHLSDVLPCHQVLQRLNDQLPPEIRFRSLRPASDSKQLRSLKWFLVGLATNGRYRNLYENLHTGDKIVMIERVSLLQDIRERLERMEMDFVCALPEQTRDGPTLKRVMEIIYSDGEPWIFQPFGARLGWLADAGESLVPFGWITQE
ncbi:TIGR03960 family B12-binding radical SAM protein [bacterium]|nr:TIGR03960 family B12-binding radical SAM protein [candidate division CSSED10-310 bacterium]